MTRVSSTSSRYPSRWAMLLLALVTLVFCADTADAQRRRDSRRRSSTSSERRAAERERERERERREDAQPPVEEEPTDLAFRALDRLSGPAAAVRERSVPASPGLTSEQLSVLAPQRRHSDALVPLRGYPTSERSSTPPQPIYADGSIGLFATTRLAVGYAGAEWPFDYSAGLDLDLSNGYDDNPHSRLEVDVAAGYVIDEGFGIFSGGHMGVDGSYLGHTYRLTAAPAAPERAVTSWTVATTGANTSGGLTYDAAALYRSTSLVDSATRRETSLEGRATLSTLMDGFTVGGTTDLRITSLGGESVSYGLLEGFVSYSAPFFTARASLGIAGGANTDVDATTAPSARAELRLFPIRGITLIGAVTSGLNPSSMAEMLSVNPYTVHGSHVRQLRENVGYQLHVRLEPSRSFGVHASARQSHYADYAWFAGPVAGVYAPSFDEARIAEIDGSLTWSPNEQDRLMTAVRFVESTVGADARSTPYIPRWTVDLHYTRRIRPMPLTIEGSFRYIGSRPRSDGTLMPPAALLGLSGGYRLSSHFELTLGLSNVLAQRYELWEGYQERGFYGELGLRTRF